MLETAGYLLERDPAQNSSFLDGRPFSRRYQIENVLAAATSLHQPWRISNVFALTKRPASDWKRISTMAAIRQEIVTISFISK